MWRGLKVRSTTWAPSSPPGSAGRAGGRRNRIPPGPGVSLRWAGRRLRASAGLMHVRGGRAFRAVPPSTYAEVMQCDKEAFSRFFHAMLERGVYLAPSAYEAGFVSSAHSEADVASTIAAAGSAFRSIS